MSVYTTSEFWAGLAERAIKTAAQAALSFLATAGAGILEWDWRGLLSITAAALLASILTSLATPTQAMASPLVVVGTKQTKTTPLAPPPPTGRHSAGASGRGKGL